MCDKFKTKSVELSSKTTNVKASRTEGSLNAMMYEDYVKHTHALCFILTKSKPRIKNCSVTSSSTRSQETSVLEASGSPSLET